MNNYQREYTEPSLSAPPRILMLLAFAFLGLVIAAAIGVVIYLTNGRRLGSLIPYAVVIAIGFPTLLILGALAFRRSLPRLLWLWLALFFLLAGVVGAFAGVAVYRSALPPRYQEEIRTQFPFMGAFLPPTPPAGLIPTVAVTSSGPSAMDLLSMPLVGGTATPQEAGASAAATEAAPTPTLEPTATATLLPTETAAATVTPSPIPPTETPLPPTAAPTEAAVLPAPTSAPVAESSAPFSLPLAARMYGFQHQQQTWNNCGPANVTMALSFFGWREDQAYAASILRPDDDDKNVSPHELVNFVNDQTQVRALYRVGGTTDLLKYFIAANFPVIIETAYTPAGYDWIGHYQTVVGYDDTIQSFYIYDSYLGSGENGEGIAEPYSEFDTGWQAFNRVFIVLYRETDEALVAQILGDYSDNYTAAEIALTTAQSEARANPQNTFAWFNMGSSFTRLGRYEEAASAFDQARRLGIPFRLNWYQFSMFEAYYEVGRYDDVLALVQTNITNSATTYVVEETYYWQGRVLEAQGDIQGARSAYQRAVNQNPRFTAAQTALNTLNS